MREQPARGVLLYDPDCGFCTRSAALVPRLGVDVDVRPMTASELTAYRIDPVRAAREMPFVHPDRRVSFGQRGVSAILRTGPLPWRALGRCLVLPGIDRLAGLGYRWVAEHREVLPGGTPSCALPQTPPSPSGQAANGSVRG